MKKFYLFLLAMLLSLGNLSADEWKVTGSDTWDPALPTNSNYSAAESTHTNADGKTITVYNSYDGGVYFMLMGKNVGDNKGYILTEAISGKVTNIAMTTSSGGSTNVTVDVYVGDQLVQEALALNEKGVTFDVPVSIDNSNQQVKIVISPAITKYNAQLTDITITYEPSGSTGGGDANISWSAESVDFTWEPNYAALLPTLSNPDGAAVTYASSDETIATIDAEGTVTLVAPGNCSISATAGSTTVSYSLTVAQANMRNQGLISWNGLDADGGFTATIGADNQFPTIQVAEGYELIGTVYDAFGQTPAEGYEGSVATIDNTGAITLVNPGTCYIGYIWGAANPFIAADNFNYLLTVQAASVSPSDNVSWSATSAQVTYNSAGVYELPTLNNPDNVAVTYASSDEAVAAINADGVVTVYKPGTATISANYGDNQKAEYVLVVDKIVFTVTFSPLVDGTFTAKLNEENVYPTMSVEPAAEAEAHWFGVVYESTNTSVATIDGTGAITLVAPGETEIYVINGTDDYAVGQRVLGYKLIVEDATVPAALQEAVFTVTDKDGNAVAAGATVAEAQAPVTAVVTDPNEGTVMEAVANNLTTGTYYEANAANTFVFEGPGEYVVSAYIENTTTSENVYTEYSFTIEGEPAYNMTAPIVEFLDAEALEVPSPAPFDKLPITMTISHQNYYEGSEMVYTINGVETVTTEHLVEIPITTPGTTEYSVYVRKGSNSKSDVVSGTYVVNPDGIAWSAESVNFTWEPNYAALLPTLLNPDGAAVTYASSDEAVATIDAEGTVTLVAPGNCSISATDETKTVSYSLTVAQANMRTLGLISWNGLDADGNFTATMGAENTFPTIQVAEGYELIGTVYQSFNPTPAEGYEGNVADIDAATGEITLVNPGTCYIGYVWGAANPFIAPDNFNYLLTVKEAPVGPQPAVFTVTDKDGNAVAAGATVAEEMLPVTAVVTNPNEGTEMEAVANNLTTGIYYDANPENTFVFEGPGEYVVSAYIYDPATELDSYTEYSFTIEGEPVYDMTAPIVEFLDADYNEVPSPCAYENLPITMTISHQNYYEGSEMVYTINGEETVTTEHVVEIPITESGVIEYSVYARKGSNSVSDVVSGTYEVLAKVLQEAVFTVTDKDGNAVENGATVAEEMLPVTAVVTNPNEGTEMEAVASNITTGIYYEANAENTFVFEGPGEYVVSAYIYDPATEQDVYTEYSFLIEGEPIYDMTAPIVEFLDADWNELTSPCAKLPVTMFISHQNYYEGTEMVYTVNGEETVTTDYYVEIPITEVGTTEYSVYVRKGSNSISDVVSGTFVVTPEALMLEKPVITITEPGDGQELPVVVTITNPNTDGVGTIMYSIGSSSWFEGYDNPVEFELTEYGTYTISAYVRNNSNEELSSEIETVEYQLTSGIHGIEFGKDGIVVIGGTIKVPEGAEIYTVSGIRINASERLSSGLYIVRLANGSTTKVIVK